MDEPFLLLVEQPTFTARLMARSTCLLLQHIQQLMPSLMLLEQDQRIATEAEAPVEN